MRLRLTELPVDRAAALPKARRHGPAVLSERAPRAAQCAIEALRGDAQATAEAKRAREAFFTAAGAFVTPAVSIDGTKIGDGKPGPITKRLRQLYLEQARRDAI